MIRGEIREIMKEVFCSLMFPIQFEETVGGLALGGGDPICDLLCFVLGLRGVPGGRRAISGPFIKYFCGISYSQGIVLMLLRGVRHRRRTKQSPGFRITKMCCYPFRDCFVPPTAGLTAGLAMTVRRMSPQRIGLLQTQLKSDPVLLKETRERPGVIRR